LKFLRNERIPEGKFYESSNYINRKRLFEKGKRVYGMKGALFYQPFKINRCSAVYVPMDAVFPMENLDSVESERMKRGNYTV